jgi:hypothetical protein
MHIRSSTNSPCELYFLHHLPAGFSSLPTLPLGSAGSPVAPKFERKALRRRSHLLPIRASVHRQGSPCRSARHSAAAPLSSHLPDPQCPPRFWRSRNGPPQEACVILGALSPNLPPSSVSRARSPPADAGPTGCRIELGAFLRHCNTQATKC